MNTELSRFAMNKSIWMFGATCALTLVALPALGYREGPPAGVTGAPGNRTCAQAGCHPGTAAAGTNVINLSAAGGATTYAPGSGKIRMMLRIVDSQGVRFGFQATARQGTGDTTQSGRLDAADTRTSVLCGNDSDRPSAGCPASAAHEYIGHTNANSTNSFSFDWTPPATDVGPVSFYIAANASRGSQNNSQIYALKITFTPAAGGGGGPRPTIPTGGVITANQFGGFQSLSPGALIEIYGSNLAPRTANWDSAFQGGRAPTSLEGVSVTINNQPAFIALVAPGQINALVPAGVGVGPTTLRVTTAAGSSDNFSVTAAARTPGLHTHPAFRSGNTQYVVAYHTDRAFVGRTGLVAGAATCPAKPGDSIEIYGLGWGATDPDVVPGNLTPGSPLHRAPNVTARFGETPATVQFAGRSPGLAGVYQLNLAVPSVADGDHQLVVEIDGVRVQQQLSITVQR